MDSKKVRELFSISKAWIYICALLLFALIILFLDTATGIICLLIAGGLTVWAFATQSSRDKKMTNYIEHFSLNIDNVTRGSIKELPIPLTVIQLDGKVIWYNPAFKALFPDRKIFDKNIEELVAGVSTEEIIKTRKNLTFEIDDIEIGDKIYGAMGTIVKTNRKADLDDYLLITYFIDKTELINLKKRYDDEQTAIGIILIDNYEELQQTLDDYQLSQMMANLDTVLNEWFGTCAGFSRKVERDRYLFVFESGNMNWLIDQKFEILDLVRDLKTGCDIPATISIGFGIRNGGLEENFETAKGSIDIALGRGGDQVVINDAGSYKFFGGNSREIEKRTKVKSRVVSGVLKDLIKGADNVIIMGHTNPDFDAFGAAIGINKLVRLCGKQAHIILDDDKKLISNMYDVIKDESGFEDVFIGVDQVKSYIMQNSLLVIVDTHRANMTPCPELVDICEKIVVIDHHRKGAEYISNTTISYQEPYASSVCELVAEILQYADERIRLTKLEAEAMYSGLMIDTKNFTVKTGVRTFEAATFLRRNGVDTQEVKRYFATDFASFMNICKVTNSAKKVSENIALAVCPEDIEDKLLTAASAADQLITFAEFEAAFVMVQLEDSVHISGRSNGKINVQMILEQLGGGGHMTVAGVQISDVTMQDAILKLEEAIAEYKETHT